MTVTFDAEALRYKDKGTHPSASIYRTGVLAAAAIRDADWDGFPPEIRTYTGETLFVPRSQRTDLEHFCRHNRIAQRRRPPIWSMLLEPFLDTVVSEDALAKIQVRLGQAGFDAAEVAAIRNRVGPVMVSFNSKVWEWGYLSLNDLLLAARPARWSRNDCARNLVIHPSSIGGQCESLIAGHLNPCDQWQPIDAAAAAVLAGPVVARPGEATTPPLTCSRRRGS